MIVLFSIAAIVAVIWGIVFLRFGGAIGVALLTILVGVCFGAEFFQISLLTLDRLLVGVLLGAYVLLRRSELFEPKQVCSWDVVFFTFLAWLTFSTLMHDWRDDGLRPASRLIFFYLFPAVMYWIGREVTLTPKALSYVYLFGAVLGVYLALTAIAEWRQVYALVFPRYIINSANTEFLGRGRGPLLNPSANGILLCLGMGSILMFWHSANGLGRAAIITCFVVICTGVLATLTRCVWLGAALGIACVVVLSFPKRLRFSVIVCGTVALSVLVAANWQSLQRFKRDKNVSAAEMSQSASIRPVLAYIAWEMFKDHPISGVGFGQYKQHDRFYLDRGSTDLNLEIGRPYLQHNICLSVLTETGLVGMNLQLLVMLIWCRAATEVWRKRDLPLETRQLGLLVLVLFCAYFANGMFQDVTIVPMVHMVWFFYGGLAIGQHIKHVSGHSPNGRMSIGIGATRPVEFRDRRRSSVG
ncbi:MAG: O-antigen ligase family protein [Planctomycetales bacterium]|nr:O-antigen ligase family protein [Planctomycetales bacterium]